MAQLSKRRLSFLAFVVLVLLCVAIGPWIIRSQRLTPGQVYERIHEGMTWDEVVAAVGQPDDINDGVSMEWYWFYEPTPYYQFKSVVVSVYFHSDRTVWCNQEGYGGQSRLEWWLGTFHQRLRRLP